MIALIKSLFSPILSLVFLILGSGLFGTFVSIRLALQGASNELIGIVASSFYAGCLIGAIRSPSWISKLNHLRTLVALSAICGAAILIQAFWINSYFWTVLRFFTGIAMGGLFVVIESWFLLLSPTELRSRALSIYLIVFYAALSLGQLFLNFIDPYSLTSFCLAGTLSFLAILPVTLYPAQLPMINQRERFSLVEAFRTSPRGFFGGVISGMLLSCVYGLAPAYGQEMGLTVPEIGIFMSVIVFGGLSLQWPLGKWADRQGRKNILICASFCAAFFSGLIALCDGIYWPLLLLFSWAFGGFSFVLYPISMAFTCEGLEERQIVAATGGFVLSYGLGAIFGPLIAPLFMAWLGSAGLFYFISGICSFLGIVGIFPESSYEKEKS